MRAVIKAGALILFLLVGAEVHASQGVPFETYELIQESVPLQQVLDGTVEAINRSTVSAQTNGRVIEILYDVDDFVEKGTVIMQLHDTTQRADLDQALAGKQEAESRFIEARDEQKRVQELYNKKLVSRSKLDTANAALSASEAQVKSSDAQVRQAKEQLSHTTIKAPYSGIVTQRHVELGEIANVGQPLMSGISLENLRISVNVPQRVISAVRSAGRARILFDDKVEVESSDIVFFPYANPQTNSFQVRIQLNEQVKGIFPGMFAKVAFTIDEVNRLLVPESAIAYRSELTGVYVVSDKGKVSLRQVRLGRHVDGKVELLAGAVEGQRVALDPVAAGSWVKQTAIRAKAGQ